MEVNPMEHSLISLLDTPTLPVAFSSRNRHRNPKGCILANDEFYVVFESYPLVVKQMAQLMSEQRFDLIPIEYLYAASVFYRKSRNPHGPSSRPIYAFCLEYTEFTCAMKPRGLWDALSGKPKEPAEVFFAYFQGRGRVNMGQLPNNFTDASALDMLMTGICERLSVARGSFREIGPLSLGPDCPQIA
jgi:hypothetical protein